MPRDSSCLARTTSLGRSRCSCGRGANVRVGFRRAYPVATARIFTPAPAAELVSRGINEILFPVGCSLALFSAGALGKRVAARPTSEPRKGA
jgi:hypothetical protein